MVISVTVSNCLLVSSKQRLSDSFTGNLHLNIIAEAYTPKIEAALEPFVYELVGKA